MVPDPEARTTMSIWPSGLWRGGSVGRGQADGAPPIYHSRRMGGTYSEVPVTEWERWVADRDATILDVREPHEWEQGTLPGAVLISQGEIVARMDELPKDRAVMCVCRSGGRSANVAAFLSFNGFEAANLSGGMKALGLQD